MAQHSFRPVFALFLPIVLACAVSSLFVSSVFAHELWISRNNYKNPAGEWCCGAEDCGIVSPNAVKTVKGGYALRGPVTYGKGVTGNDADGPTRSEQLNEVVPYSQTLPSLDGAYWRCKRPDGSARCFFAPQNLN